MRGGAARGREGRTLRLRRPRAGYKKAPVDAETAAGPGVTLGERIDRMGRGWEIPDDVVPVVAGATRAVVILATPDPRSPRAVIITVIAAGDTTILEVPGMLAIAQRDVLAGGEALRRPVTP